MEELFFTVLKGSSVAAVLGVIVWWQNKRVERYEIAAEAREQARQIMSDAREQRLTSRLDSVQGAQAKEWRDVVNANTAMGLGLASETRELRRVNSQIHEALLQRPCLIDPPIAQPYKPIKTPLPQKPPHR